MENAATKKYSISNPPPPGDKEVGQFVWELFSESRADKEDREYPERWRKNYALYRGQHWTSGKVEHQKFQITVNLMLNDRERTVTNLCARDPKVEVKVIGGLPGMVGPVEMNRLMNIKLEAIGSEINLRKLTKRAVHVSETYGTEFDRFVSMQQPVNLPGGGMVYRCLNPVFEQNDPFSHFMSPDNFGQPSDGPYHIVATIWDVETARRFYPRPDGTPNDDLVAEEEFAKELLGGDRRGMTPKAKTRVSSGAGFDSNYLPSLKQHSTNKTSFSSGRCLILECWIKDFTEETIEVIDEESEPETVPVIDPATGYPVMDEMGQVVTEQRPRTLPLKQLKYPGGIRMITVGNRGKVVLKDVPNPNVNPALPRELTKNTFLYDKFPFYKMVSCHDEQSPYGFSLAEQVGPINLKIDELVSTIYMNARLQANPIMYVSKDTGIASADIKNSPNTVLRPAYAASVNGIGYVTPPPTGSDLKWTLEMLLRLRDQLAAFQEVDRGEAPTGVIAAASIQLLQEANRSLRENKISEVDDLVAWRGACMISNLQNFGWETETLVVDNQPVAFTGTDHASYRYQFVVQHGSSYIQSDSQVFKDALELYKLGAIDTEELLTKANWADRRAVIARMNPDSMNAAINKLLDLGAITPQDATIIQGKIAAIQMNQVPDASGAEAPLPGLQGEAAGKPNQMQAALPPGGGANASV